MEYLPPISNRETEKLLEIIRNPEDWKPSALEQARTELESRGIGIDEQNNQEKSFKKHRKRTLFIKEKASYSKLEVLLMVLFGPILIAVLGDVWLFSTEPEYKKKKKQGWIALILGIVFWLFVLSQTLV